MTFRESHIVFAAALMSNACVPPSAEPQHVTVTKTAEIEIAATVSREDRYPRQEVVLPNGVHGMPDIVYATRPGYRPLTLDLYLPPHSATQPATGYPLVVHIH